MLDRRLQEKEGMSREASHGLIGKYVYLKYLRARENVVGQEAREMGHQPRSRLHKDCHTESFPKRQ